MRDEVVAVWQAEKGGVFEVVLGDLLTAPVAAIVNAANGHLAHGGGVAAAISRAAGPELDRESTALVRARGVVPTGEAVVTTAGRLPFQGVIHAVGPRAGAGAEEDTLMHACVAAFHRAHERGWDSVAFPAVSSGIFAVPVTICARAYVRAVRAFWAQEPGSPLRRIRLMLMPGPMAEAVREALGA